MAICVPAGAGVPGTTITDRTSRVMRWTFSRDHETVVCELGLNSDDSAYELRIAPPWNPTGLTAEVFDDAMSAFERHGAIERILIDDGWSLERFESGRVPR
jgi:hypothetical protein